MPRPPDHQPTILRFETSRSTSKGHRREAVVTGIQHGTISQPCWIFTRNLADTARLTFRGAGLTVLIPRHWPARPGASIAMMRQHRRQRAQSGDNLIHAQRAAFVGIPARKNTVGG